MQDMRQHHGGEQLAIFKIGISQCLERRVQYYYEGNFSSVRCLHASNSLAQIEMLEASLVDYFRTLAPIQCRNTLGGGEGMRFKDGRPRNPPPFFCTWWLSTPLSIRGLEGRMHIKKLCN